MSKCIFDFKQSYDIFSFITQNSVTCFRKYIDLKMNKNAYAICVLKNISKHI